MDVIHEYQYWLLYRYTVEPYVVNTPDMSAPPIVNSVSWSHVHLIQYEHTSKMCAAFIMNMLPRSQSVHISEVSLHSHVF